MRPPTTMTFSGKQAVEMISMCVYAWVRGTQWLYVGKSAHGIGRLAQHHAIRLTLIQDTDEILLWRFDTEDAALRFEAEMIHVNNPLCNRAPATPSLLGPAPKPRQPRKVKPKHLPPMTSQELKESNEKIADKARAIWVKQGNVLPGRSHAGAPIVPADSEWGHLEHPSPQAPTVRRYFKAARQFSH